MKEEIDVLEQTVSSDYKYGFVTDIDTDIVPKGLNEDVLPKKMNLNGYWTGA